MPSSYGRRYPAKKKGALTTVQRKQIRKLAQRATQTQAELKYFDVTVAGSGLTGTWQLNRISSISQGVGDTGRIGDSISIRDIEIKLKFLMNSSFTTVNGGNICRFMVVQSFSDDTTALTAGKIVEYPGPAATAPYSPYTHDTRRLYKVLYDEMVPLSVGGPTCVTRTIIVKPYKKEIRYVGAGTNGEGQIYVMWCSDTSTNSPLLDYIARVNYIDL